VADTHLEAARWDLRPETLAIINRQLCGYAAWFSEVRVHQGLAGGSPHTVHAGRPPRKLQRLEAGRRYALSIHLPQAFTTYTCH